MTYNPENPFNITISEDGSSDSLSVTDVSTPASSVSDGGHEPSALVAPYVKYLPPHKRRELALKEFEVQMAERELKVLEADKDRAKYLTPKRRVYTVPFYMQEQKLKIATERFPRTIFKVGQDCAHDHPIAHIENMIGMDQIVRRIPGGNFVFDVYGSPTRCHQLNIAQLRSVTPKAFYALVSRKTEKDYLRSSHWTGLDYFDMTGMEDFSMMFSGEDPLFPVDMNTTFMFGHSLYYVDEDDLQIMLNSAPGVNALALVHRHPGQRGTMFGGEITYAKRPGIVEQVNVETGERYTHRDLSYLFESTTKVRYTSFGAYTWTMHKVTEDTWIIELTSCADGLNERFPARVKHIGRPQAIAELNTHADFGTDFKHPVLAKLPGADCTMVGGIPVLKITNTSVSVNLTCPDLVEYLMTHMMGKPRTPQTLQDCFALARTHVADGANFAGKLNFRVSAADLPGHVMLGFLSGVPGEIGVLRSLAVYRKFVREHHALADFDYVCDGDKQSVVATALSVASRVNKARKEGDVVGGALLALRNN